MKLFWSNKDPNDTNALQLAVDEYHDRVTRQQQTARENAAEREQRRERYFTVRDTVIQPTLQAARQTVAAEGEACEIICNAGHLSETIMLVLYPSAQPRTAYTEDTAPKLRFSPADDYRQIVAQAVIDQLLVYGEHLGEWPTEELTVADVQAVLVKFVMNVFHLPKNEASHQPAPLADATRVGGD